MKHIFYAASVYNIKITDSSTPAIWACSKCYFRELPFVSLRDIQDVNENTDLPSSTTYYVNVHAEKLKQHHKHLGITHLNTEFMSSTFDEFQVAINENQFDIVTLFGTWLHDDKHLLDYAKIPGYNLVYKNREQKRGGGVGAYLKEELDFKICDDLNRLYTTIEQLCLEIKGKNKKSSILLGIVYQTSPQIEKKMERLGKIETMLSIIESTFTGTIILAGDTNINVHKP